MKDLGTKSGRSKAFARSPERLRCELRGRGAEELSVWRQRGGGNEGGGEKAARRSRKPLEAPGTTNLGPSGEGEWSIHKLSICNFRAVTQGHA